MDSSVNANRATTIAASLLLTGSFKYLLANINDAIPGTLETLFKNCLMVNGFTFASNKS